MKDKFCVSRTLVYILGLAVLVVGVFYAMNYTNTSKLTTNTEAASKCYAKNPQTGKRQSGIYSKGTSCSTGFKQGTDANPPLTAGYICCVGQIANYGAGGSSKSDCNRLKDTIAKTYGPNECTVYTGGYNEKLGTCKVLPSADGIECSAGVGRKKKDRQREIKQLCRDLKDTTVTGSVKGQTGNNLTCLVYSGAWRQGGNIPPGQGMSYFCMRDNKSDIWDKTKGEYKKTNGEYNCR